MSDDGHDTDAPGSDPLRDILLSGKRCGPRAGRVIGVALVRDHVHVLGSTCDVSRSGVLVEVTNLEQLSLGSAASLLAASARVSAMFPCDFHVRFAEERIDVRATIVRVTVSPGNRSLMLGCRFATPLADDQCAALGVAPDGDETSKSGTSKAAAQPEGRKDSPAMQEISLTSGKRRGKGSRIAP